MPPPKVYVVSWCRSMDQLYGASLVFKTLRTGFPTAEVIVIENASPPELRAPILQAAKAVECEVVQLETEALHSTLIKQVVMAASEPVVFIDPDVVFWQAVQDWTFGPALMAGRYLPDFDDPYSNTRTLSRLHTAHLWFPDPVTLRARMEEIRQQRWEVGDFFEPSMRPPGWWRWDTAAVLFHALRAEASRFGDRELDAYDHLFCGSHLNMVLPAMGEAGAPLEACTPCAPDQPAIRGVWREQELFFASRPWMDQGRP